jgi:hypothetical protein
MIFIEMSRIILKVSNCKFSISFCLQPSDLNSMFNFFKIFFYFVIRKTGGSPHIWAYTLKFVGYKVLIAVV